MRRWHLNRTLGSRLVAASLVACVLMPPVPAVAISASRATTIAPEDAGVRIMLPAAPAVGPEGFEVVPVSAVLLPEGPGTIYYRLGAAPGAWRRYRGPVPMPEGKQTISAVLVSPDGISGPVSERVVRTDFNALPVAGAGATVTTQGTATYTGTSSVAGQVTVGARVVANVGTNVRRIGGQNRYDVSVGLAQMAFRNPEYVIIASGEKFPDALSASGLAGCLGAPLLLVRQKSVPPQIAQQIGAMGARKAIVCGGPSTVSEGVLRSLRGMGLQVERIGGATRYDVGANIAERIYALTGSTAKVYIARGDIYPDALSLGPLAYRNKAPILLVLPKAMPPATYGALSRHRYGSAAIAGGTASVSPRTEAVLGAMTGGVTRWGGATRYDTAATVASAGVAGGTNSWEYVGIAKGTVFSDALCGGVAAGAQGGVILLTDSQPLTRVTANTLTAHAGDIRQCDVYGGPVSVTESTFNQIRAIFR